MNETAMPFASIAPIQIVSPLSGLSGQGAARRLSIFAASHRGSRREQIREIVGCDTEIDAGAVAKRQRALEGLDQRVRVFEAVDAWAPSRS